MLRGVYPQRTAEILRYAQDDSEGLSMTDSNFFTPSYALG